MSTDVSTLPDMIRDLNTKLRGIGIGKFSLVVIEKQTIVFTGFS